MTRSMRFPHGTVPNKPLTEEQETRLRVIEEERDSIYLQLDKVICEITEAACAIPDEGIIEIDFTGRDEDTTANEDDEDSVVTRLSDAFTAIAAAAQR